MRNHSNIKSSFDSLWNDDIRNIIMKSVMFSMTINIELKNIKEINLTKDNENDNLSLKVLMTSNFGK